MIASMNLVVINDGKHPTFDTGARSSYIDVTIATPKVARRFASWGVSDKESLSDHKYIFMQIQQEKRNEVASCSSLQSISPKR